MINTETTMLCESCDPQSLLSPYMSMNCWCSTFHRMGLIILLPHHHSCHTDSSLPSFQSDHLLADLFQYCYSHAITPSIPTCVQPLVSSYQPPLPVSFPFGLLQKQRFQPPPLHNLHHFNSSTLHSFQIQTI